MTAAFRETAGAARRHAACGYDWIRPRIEVRDDSGFGFWSSL